MVKSLYPRVRVLLFVIPVLFVPALVAAQEPLFDVSGHVVFSATEFEKTDIGVGGRFGWRPASMFGVEAEFSVYPSDFPETPGALSGSRVEALFGATFGPRVGRARFFGRVRPGLLRYGQAPTPIVCIAIFPTPLSCQLAGGKTLFALDLGAGVEVDLSRRSFARVDLGDRMVRYPDPTFRPDGMAFTDGFYGHDLRVAISAGMRF